MLGFKACASIARLNFYLLRKGFGLAVPKDTVGLGRESMMEELEEVVRSLPQSGRQGGQILVLSCLLFHFVQESNPWNGDLHV